MYIFLTIYDVGDNGEIMSYDELGVEKTYRLLFYFSYWEVGIYELRVTLERSITLHADSVSSDLSLMPTTTS